jgi:hypothetical protein
MLPLAAAVAVLAATRLVEQRVSLWILSALPAEQELRPYAHLVDDPACLAVARAMEVAAAVGAAGGAAEVDAAVSKRCPQLRAAHLASPGLAAQLAAAEPRSNQDLRASLNTVRSSAAATTADLDALGLELARSRAEAFVGDGMVHLMHTRDIGRDVLRPLLCADVSGSGAVTTLSCAGAAEAWRGFVGLSSWVVVVGVTWLALSTRDSAMCVRGLLCHGLARLGRCAIVLCTTLPLTHHRCRLLYAAGAADSEAAGAVGATGIADSASGEELAACAEQFMRFRATLALTCVCAAVFTISSMGGTREAVSQSTLPRWRYQKVRVLACAIMVTVLVLGVFGESVALIGYTADAIAVLVIIPSLWWASGPLAEILGGGGGQTAGVAVGATASGALPTTLTSRGGQLAWLWLAFGAMLGVLLSAGPAAVGEDELWCAPLRGWVCAGAAIEIAAAATGARHGEAAHKIRAE